MNGFSTFNLPSLNGLRRNDGTNRVESVQQLTGNNINHTTNDSSFVYSTRGDSTVVLEVPFSTVEDVLTTEKLFKAKKILSEEPIDAPLNIQAGNNITIDRNELTNQYTISARTVLGGGSFGSWSFEEHPEGYLNLMKNGKPMFRFLSDPINVMTRVSLFKMLQNGSWHIQKTN